MSGRYPHDARIGERHWPVAICGGPNMMSLDTVLALVPDRVQLIFLDAKGGFGLGELDIGLPRLPRRVRGTGASFFPGAEVGAWRL